MCLRMSNGANPLSVLRSDSGALRAPVGLAFYYLPQQDMAGLLHEKLVKFAP